MTENGKELEEVRRAHAALENRLETLIPALATKADLEATARQLSTEMRDGFNRLTIWLAGTIITVLIALGGFFASGWSRAPAPAVVVYPPPAQAPAAAGPLAPPSQP